MAEQLQELLDRIQKDGVEKAEGRASEIEQEAKANAEAILADATAKAATIIEDAEKGAKAFETQGQNALRQAARDVILSVRAAIEHTLDTLTRTDVASALNGEAFAEAVRSMLEAYFAAEPGKTDVTLLLNDNQKKMVSEHLMATLSETLKGGVTIAGERGVIAGLRVSLTDQGVEHDFTDKAIADALSKLLRPHLATIVEAAIQDESS